MRFLSKLAIIMLGCVIAAPSFAQQITGAGSTFVYPILSKWSAAYNEMKGVQVNYQSIGSGGGIAQIKAATVDFGASDAPLPPDQLSQIGLAQFPLVIGGIVPVFNIEGVDAGQIALHRSASGRHLSRQNQAVERSGAYGCKSGREAAGPGDHRRPSLRWIGHDV